MTRMGAGDVSTLAQASVVLLEGWHNLDGVDELPE